MAGKFKLTEDQKSNILKLREQNLTYREIGKQINIHENIVRRFLIKSNKPVVTKRWTEEQLKEALTLYLQGNKYIHEIAAEFGFTKEGLRKYLVSQGIDTSRKEGVRRHKLIELATNKYERLLLLPETEINKKLQLIASKTVINEKGCHIWTGDTANKGGNKDYGRLRIHSETYPIHKIIYVLHHKDPIIDHYKNPICHKCDTPRCHNIEHLEKGTPSKNVKDAFDRGRKTSIRKAPFLIKEIRKDFSSGIPEQELRIKYNLDRQVLRNILLRRTYKNV